MVHQKEDLCRKTEVFLFLLICWLMNYGNIRELDVQLQSDRRIGRSGLAAFFWLRKNECRIKCDNLKQLIAARGSGSCKCGFVRNCNGICKSFSSGCGGAPDGCLGEKCEWNDVKKCNNFKNGEEIRTYYECVVKSRGVKWVKLHYIATKRPVGGVKGGFNRS